MMAPEGATIVSVRSHLLRSNLAVDPGTVAEDADLNTDLVVFQFVQALKFAHGQSFIFLVAPMSRIEAKAELPGDNVSKSITGFGDAQLGFVLGVHGTPSPSLRLSYGGLVSRNEHGPNGWMARAILGFVL